MCCVCVCGGFFWFVCFFFLRTWNQDADPFRYSYPALVDFNIFPSGLFSSSLGRSNVSFL